MALILDPVIAKVGKAFNVSGKYVATPLLSVKDNNGKFVPVSEGKADVSFTFKHPPIDKPGTTTISVRHQSGLSAVTLVSVTAASPPTDVSPSAPTNVQTT